MNGTKDFAFAQELSIEDRTKKEMHCVLLKQHECSVSRGFPLGYGCRYTDAAACNDDENVELSRDQKTRSTQRTKRPRDYSETIKRSSRQKTCGSGQGREVERPDAAQVRSHRVPPPADRTGARKQKRSFLLEGARDARAGWQQLGGGTEAVFSTKTQNG